jgi:hypothetical protein
MDVLVLTLITQHVLCTFYEKYMYMVSWSGCDVSLLLLVSIFCSCGRYNEPARLP